jgi:hypothetical protein
MGRKMEAIERILKLLSGFAVFDVFCYNVHRS